MANSGNPRPCSQVSSRVLEVRGQVDQFQCSGDRLPRVRAGARRRVVEHGHQAVAHDLEVVAAVARDAFAGALEVFGEDSRDFGDGEFFRDGREAADVAEQDRHVLHDDFGVGRGSRSHGEIFNVKRVSWPFTLKSRRFQCKLQKSCFYIEDAVADFFELNADQKRQLIDAESVFTALEQAETEALRYRGSMFWREQAGGTYLIRMTATSRQRSLGPASPENEIKFERFNARKVEIEQRVKQLRERMDTVRRMNKALRVGRTPDILVDVLNVLMRFGVADHFLVVGTHALYAFETAAGVRFPSDVMATMDADFLFDTGRRAEFLEIMSDRKTSFMGLLQKVDKTFERRETEKQTAVNAAGYEIDLLRRFPPDPEDASEHPLQITQEEGDLWPVRASMGQKLLSVPRFSQVIVGLGGGMARMRTVHPLHFARIKRELARQRGRDPLKKKKDRGQAEQVERLVQEYLVHLSA